MFAGDPLTSKIADARLAPVKPDTMLEAGRIICSLAGMLPLKFPVVAVLFHF